MTSEPYTGLVCRLFDRPIHGRGRGASQGQMNHARDGTRERSIGGGSFENHDRSIMHDEMPSTSPDHGRDIVDILAGTGFLKTLIGAPET